MYFSNEMDCLEKAVLYVSMTDFVFISHNDALAHSLYVYCIAILSSQIFSVSVKYFLRPAPAVPDLHLVGVEPADGDTSPGRHLAAAGHGGPGQNPGHAAEHPEWGGYI